MFETVAGIYMATKIHFAQMKYPFAKKRDRIIAEEIYKNEINKIEETEKYEKSKLPESGYMTVEEYEAKSRAKSKKEMASEVKGGELSKDPNMVYVPQKTFKLDKYNNPVGSPEISLPRDLNFDRQINAQGIISGNKSIMVYPTIYYYAESDCTSCDLFLIKLDPKLTDTEKVIKANIVEKEIKPILSTDKDISTKFLFRTLTPIDFSSDNKKLIIIEKIGHRHDGIWKTELWVYDFEQKEAKKLPQIRDAIINYWAEAGGVDFDENRWDIYPMGFDANDNNRIIICAYAYTGDIPNFLGTWSIDTSGENSKLENLDGSGVPISIVGYKLAEDSVIEASEIEFQAKLTKQQDKQKKDENKKNEDFNKKLKEVEHKRKLQQMDMDTYLKIKQRQEQIKNLKKNSKSNNGLTGIN